MRLWPFRRRAALPALYSHDLLLGEEQLRELAEEVMVIKERQIRGGIILFRGELRAEPARALDTLLTRVAPLGYPPSLRADGEGVVLQAWPLGEVVERPRPILNLVLFILTALSTLAAGALLGGGFDPTSATAWLAGA